MHYIGLCAYHELSFRAHIEPYWCEKGFLHYQLLMSSSLGTCGAGLYVAEICSEVGFLCQLYVLSHVHLNSLFTLYADLYGDLGQSVNKLATRQVRNIDTICYCLSLSLSLSLSVSLSLSLSLIRTLTTTSLSRINKLWQQSKPQSANCG
jgi:hypothetical protein